MPKIEKQNPKPSTNGSRTKAPAGSILSEAIPIDELPDDYIKMVIYGENRVGKTTLACQFPKPLLLISMEPNKTGGAQSVKKVVGVTYIRVNSTLKFLELAKELRERKQFETVVIDSATSLQDVVLKEVLNLSELPEMLTWGQVTRDQYRVRSEKTRECLRPYIDLPCHLVCTAKQRDHNPQEKEKPVIVRSQQIESFFAADLGGATVGWLHDACDYICQLCIQKEVRETETKVGNDVIRNFEETGKLLRRLRTMYHPNFAAGFRSCNPEVVPDFINNPTYEKIATVISGSKLKQ